MSTPPAPTTKVFVSGCYDILHAGHIQFFKEARALGDHLTVSFASREVLWEHKRRRSALPDGHKEALIRSLRMVDDVVVGRGPKQGLDFEDDFLRVRPRILAVTEDDQYADLKRELCARVGARYVTLPKTPPAFEPVTTTRLVRRIQAPAEIPLRVDFGGGWLDVPRHARPGAYIVNCAISPLVTLANWPYELSSGLGGSGAWAILNGEDGIESELAIGVGWQDPAVIFESGLCVWRSGERPSLEFKRDGSILAGRMALMWTGRAHNTPSVSDRQRDYALIEQAGRAARDAVLADDFAALAAAVDLSHQAQVREGMTPLPAHAGAVARKYCGGGFGGYGLHLFADPAARDAFLATPGAMKIEPHVKHFRGL
ncbi:MAG: adenylyltransferase/cytidyltransferase family protein [Kiritimatiellia bacterium]